MGINIDRKGLGDTDGVGKLQRAAFGQTCGHDVFRQIACGVGRGAVYLCRILAGKRAAAVGGGPAVGVDDDLASGQACVPVGATDDEFPGRVDVPFCARRNPAFGQDFTDIRLNYGAHIVRGHGFVKVLGGKNDRAHANGCAVLIDNGQL